MGGCKGEHGVLMVNIDRGSIVVKSNSALGRNHELISELERRAKMVLCFLFEL